LVLFGTFVSHRDLGWENPSVSRFFRLEATESVAVEVVPLPVLERAVVVILDGANMASTTG